MKAKNCILWILIIMLTCIFSPPGITNVLGMELPAYNVLAAGDHDTELNQIDQAIDNISNYYADSADAYQDGWKVMEMSLLGRKTDVLDNSGTLIQYIEQATSEINPASLSSYAKAAIVLTSLGMDVENLDDYGSFIDSKGNPVTNLIANIANFSSDLDIYGAPFALLAYDCAPYQEPAGCTITREDIINYLLDAQLASGLWDDGYAAAFGFKDVDTTAMVIVALAPYYNNYPADANIEAAITTALDDAVAALSAAQEDNGAFSSWGSVNSNSTSMVALALVSLGLDPSSDPAFVKTVGDVSSSILDGIMAFQTDSGLFGWDSNTTFNDLATEQVLRSLIALKLYYNNEVPTYFYQFGEPDLAPKTLTGIELISAPSKTTYYLNDDFDLSSLSINATYSGGIKESLVIYDDMINGYDNQTTGTQTITITHQGFSCSFNVQVKKASSGSGGSTTEEAPTVSLKVLDNQNDSILFLTEIEITTGDSVLDVLQKALKAEGITYSIKNGYVKGINGLYEKDNGPNSGWLYTVNGDSPSVSADTYELDGGEKIVFYYTDDYTVGNNFEEEETTEEETTTDTSSENNTTLTFPDINNVSSWAKESVIKAAEAGIIHGDDKGNLIPKTL